MPDCDLRLPLLLVLLLATPSANTQDQKLSGATKRPPSGTIAGRVLCNDSNSAARFATVFTIPIPEFDASGKPTLPKVNGRDVVETDLDGDYTLPMIAPGDYFVAAEMEGYLSPVWQFTEREMEDLTPERIKKLTNLLPSVRVEPGKTSHADITLERGGSISGTINYDDGSPGIGIHVHVEPARGIPADRRPSTQGIIGRPAEQADDQGHYRINGLPAGKYVIEAVIGLPTFEENPMAAESKPDPYQGYPLGSAIIPFYAEKTVRKKEAKIYEVESGEDLSGADIEIPVRGLHSISGTVVAQGNQPPIVFGSVSLHDVNDNTFERSTWVVADGSFQFRNLPPGKYELKTTRLSDHSPDIPGQSESGSTHVYAAQTITVQIVDKDLNDVVIAVPESAESAIPTEFCGRDDVVLGDIRLLGPGHQITIQGLSARGPVAISLASDGTLEATSGTPVSANRLSPPR